ncbi:MAG: SMC-Scp complex subunit ScpB [Rickettsiales bacterium]|nr:SMC-Scp complex subunit ScpB [Rickettsiales bacterium]|tara:strand:- start:218 stop:913 length:696 start_codon:yes stop_codon:yes gene_type:complete
MSEVAQAVENEEFENTFDYDDVTIKRLIEAVVFASSEPVSINEISKRVGEDVDVKAVIQALQDDYEERGINLVERGGFYCFRSANDLGDKLELEKELPRKLSKAAMETLAIIAYHQPVTRPEIESIRGVAVSKGTLDLLMEEGWINLGRRREVPGRPVTWKTTRDFLDMFGLETLKDLPGIQEMKDAGLLDARASIDIVGGTTPETQDMFDDEEDDFHDDDLYDNKDDMVG